jgi:hypothetical protein
LGSGKKKKGRSRFIRSGKRISEDHLRESEDHFILTEDRKKPSDFENYPRSNDFQVLCGAIDLLCRSAETVFSAFFSTARTEALERSLGGLLQKPPAT